MLASLLAVVLAATAADANIEAHSGASGQSETPLLVARDDGVWTITRAIHADPVEFPFVADERLDGGLDAELADDGGEREMLRQLELDAQFERAFEEAIDGARAAAPPQ